MSPWLFKLEIYYSIIKHDFNLFYLQTLSGFLNWTALCVNIFKPWPPNSQKILSRVKLCSPDLHMIIMQYRNFENLTPFLVSNFFWNIFPPKWNRRIFVSISICKAKRKFELNCMKNCFKSNPVEYKKLKFINEWTMLLDYVAFGHVCILNKNNNIWLLRCTL